MSERDNHIPARGEVPKPLGHHKRVLAALTALAVVGGGVTAAGISVEARDNRQNAAMSTLRQRSRQQDRKIDRLSQIAGSLAGVPKAVAEGAGLHSVHELPGYGQEVSRADEALFRAATVKIVRWPKGTSPASAADDCTGMKVSVNGASYVATAGHCVAPNKGGYVPLPAFNITKDVPYSYGVQTVAPDNQRGEIVPVTDISLSGTLDWALLRTDSTSSAAQGFETAPAIPYEDRLVNHLPLPGQGTVVFSMPEASNGEMLMGKGIFLGTAPDPGGDPSRELDWVGLYNADVPADDACNYGASGSTAVLAGGSVTGPLAVRNNIHYKDNLPDTPPESPQSSIQTRLLLSQSLLTDLMQFDTVCGYSSGDSGTITDLVKGFALYPDITPPPTGGMK